MGQLTEATLDEVIARGCSPCGSKRLSFRAFLDARLPLLAGEPAGALAWVYDGEKFVDGVYEISCAVCNHGVFRTDLCPRCHSEGGLARALGDRNRWPVPLACPSCEGEELRYIALVPARVVYEGRRAEKARTTVELVDAGFHGVRADCADCGTVAKQDGRCPLCDAPGPLRERPG